MEIINSRLLKILSIGLLVWGVFLCLESFMVLSTGITGEIAKHAETFYFNEENSIYIADVVRRNSFIQLFVASLVIASGAGLFFLKKWAYLLTLFLSITGVVYTCYRTYRDLYHFQHDTAWYFFPVLAIFISIIVILKKSIIKKK